MKKYLVRLILGMELLFYSSHYVRADWVQTNGPTGGRIRALAVNGTTIFTGTYGDGVFLSTNDGTSWTAINSGLPDTYVMSLAVSGKNIFAGTYAGVCLSTDNGASWTLVKSSGLILSIVISGNNVFAGSLGGGVFLSINNGTSWTTVNGPDYLIKSLAVSGSAIFASTMSGLSPGGDGVFVSTDDGTSWTRADSGLPIEPYAPYVGSFAVSGSTIFARTGSHGVFLSTNNGTSWTAVNSGLTNLFIGSLAVSGNNIFAGTWGGVFLSVNNGTSWTSVNSGFPNNISVNSFAVSGNTIFAGTDSNGVWRRPLSELTGVTNHNPQGEMLSQANLKIFSPSRTSPNVTIEISLPYSDRVTAAIYDLSGHEIASLVDKQFGSGQHSLVWNGRNKAPGCYAVRMRVGSNTYVKTIPVFR